MKKLVAFVKERAAIGDRPAMIEGGAAFAYVFGKVLVFLLLVEALTGAALAAFYSPSTTDAWGSVAYLQDQTSWGWIVRGLHHHGGGAIVIVAGLHLVQTAVAGAYKRPRELVWWLGVVLLLLVLAWAVTGFVLPYDQAGYWANRVELGIAAETPVLGGAIRDVALGGNDYGNLTLTRFYTLHVVILPATVTLLVVLHIWLARRHGTTPVRARAAAPRWPDQAVRDALAMALAIAILLGYTISQGGAELAAPADPANAYDARPLWYFRWLFELRELSGSAEQLVAMIVPAIVGGFLVGLPVIDRKPGRNKLMLGALAGLFAAIGALTVMSFARDSGDAALGKRQAEARQVADRARAIAKQHGVPATGAQDLFLAQPYAKARAIFAQKCAGCHADPEHRVGPVIGPGHGDRKWLAAFLADPSHDVFWGRTQLVQRSRLAKQLEEASPTLLELANFLGLELADLAMPAQTSFKPAELANLVEALYAQSGARDVDPQKLAAGLELFSNACTECHSIEEGGASTSGPGLGRMHDRGWYVSYLGNPAAPYHMGELAEMPRFDGELTIVERDLVAEYLVWLRTATQADLDSLDR